MTVNKITKAPTQNEIINTINDLIDNKQDTISDLSTIRSNAANGQSAYTTIGGYGDIVTYNASNFVQKNGDSSTQTISLTSGTGTTALGIKSMATSSYISFSGSSGWLGSFGVTSNKRPAFYNGTGYTLAYTSEIPTNTSELTNDSGYITGIGSNDVITALGYVPYSATNPNGYTSNVGTVTSVNNTQPDANGNVTIQTGGATDVQINGTSITSNNVANILTESAYSASNKIATMSDLPSTSGFLENTATGTNSLTIGGTPTSVDAAVNIGYNSSVALSAGGQAARGTAIGVGASVTGTDSIQLGMGTASSNSSLYAGFYIYGNYQLLDGTTGLIPDARISANIARTSQIPSTSGLANTSLSNLSSTGQKVIDGQWVYKYSEASTATAVATVTIDLSSYLPSDGYQYEVLINLCVYSNPNSGATDVYLWSDTFANTNTGAGQRIARANASSRASECRFIMPVGSGRWLKRQIVDKASTSTCVVSLWGYRRIGTNT